MSNTGRKIYSNLQQVFVDTGVATSEPVKPNIPTDPNYIAPTIDLETCPVTTVEQTSIIARLLVENSINHSIFLENVEFKAQVGQSYFSGQVRNLPNQNQTLMSVNYIDDVIVITGLIKSISAPISVNVELLYKEVGNSQFSSIAQLTQLVQSSSFSLIGLAPRGSIEGICEIKLKITQAVVENEIDTPPSVNVGPNITTNENSLALSATAFDDKGIVQTQWSQVSGPTSVSFTTPLALQTNINNLIIEGEYKVKLEVTDTIGQKASKILSIVKQNQQSELGLVNAYVDNAMLDSTFQIAQITLTNSNSFIALLAAPINRLDGIVLKTPPKGTYDVTIAIQGNVGGSKSLQLFSPNQSISINPPSAGEYIFKQIVVGEGNQGLLISYLSVPSINPSFPIVYAKKEVSTPQSVVTENVLPFGLIESTLADVSVNFSSDEAGTVPTSLTKKIVIKITENNVLTGASRDIFLTQTAPGLSVYVGNIQAVKRWDYTLNNPALAEPIEDLIEHFTYTYTIVPDEGYLIVP